MFSKAKKLLEITLTLSRLLGSLCAPLLMKRTLIILLFLLVFTPALFSSAWTVLVYLAADNGLDETALAEIEEMERATFSKDLKVVIQLDRWEYADPTYGYRYLLKHDPTPGIQSTVLSAMEEVDSGDPTTLNSFLKWGFSRYPANHKAVVVWGHGNSWYKGNRWIGADYTSNSFISVAKGQLAQAFSGLSAIDIVLLDACNMQTIEVATELAPYCKYLVASEDLVPATGFPYDQVFTQWETQPTSLALAQLLPNLYVQSYEPGGSQNLQGYNYKIQASTIDCTNLNLLISSISQFSQQFYMAATTLSSLREKAYPFNDLEADIDLGEWFKTVLLKAPSEPMRSMAGQIVALLPQVFIAADWYNYPCSPGTASIWYPQQKSTFVNLWPLYGQSHFAKTAWSKYLNRSFGNDTTPPLKPTLTKVKQKEQALILGWNAPLDPDSLQYKVTINYGKGLPNVYYTSHNSLSVNVTNKGYVLVQAIDSAGNYSAADSAAFQQSVPAAWLSFSPNPCYDLSTAKFTWSIPLDDYPTSVRIFNIKGALISERAIQIPLRTTEYSWVEAGLPKDLSTGFYILELVTSQRKIHKRIVIIR